MSCESDSSNLQFLQRWSTDIDLSMDHELFTAQYPKDSKGVRARVKGGMKV